jgi:hypothetical protein
MAFVLPSFQRENKSRINVGQPPHSIGAASGDGTIFVVGVCSGEPMHLVAFADPAHAKVHRANDLEFFTIYRGPISLLNAS